MKLLKKQQQNEVIFWLMKIKVKIISLYRIKNVNFSPVIKQIIRQNSTAYFVFAPFMHWETNAAAIFRTRTKE